MTLKTKILIIWGIAFVANAFLIFLHILKGIELLHSVSFYFAIIDLVVLIGVYKFMGNDH